VLFCGWVDGAVNPQTVSKCHRHQTVSGSSQEGTFR